MVACSRLIHTQHSRPTDRPSESLLKLNSLPVPPTYNVDRNGYDDATLSKGSAMATTIPPYNPHDHTFQPASYQHVPVGTTSQGTPYGQFSFDGNPGFYPNAMITSPYIPCAQCNPYISPYPQSLPHPVEDLHAARLAVSSASLAEDNPSLTAPPLPVDEQILMRKRPRFNRQYTADSLTHQKNTRRQE